MLTSEQTEARAREITTDFRARRGIVALVLAVQRETIETAVSVIAGADRPERVCCIRTCEDIQRKLHALVPEEPSE